MSKYNFYDYLNIGLYMVGMIILFAIIFAVSVCLTNKYLGRIKYIKLKREMQEKRNGSMM